MLKNVLAEQSVAGSLLIDALCLPEVRKCLAADDFSMASNRSIYEAAVRLADSGQPVDPVTILSDARSHGAELSEDYLMQLMEVTPTAANAAQYAQAVHDEAVRRRIAEAAGEILDQAEDPTVPTAELLSKAQERLQRIDAGTASALVSSQDAAVAFLSYRERLEQSGGAVVRTGYRKLDSLLGGGMVAEGLYILAARPGVGKTTLGLKIADFAAREGQVLFVSLEMSREQLTARLVADRSGISIGRALLGTNPTDAELDKMAEALNDLSKSGLVLNQKPSATVEEISAMARQLSGLRLVVVDYLGLVQSDLRGATIYERVTANSNALKRLARSLGVPILCLAQLNRASEQRPDKQPTMADLRDSGAIEQDADAVLLLHRPAFYWPDSQKPKPYQAELLEVNLVKNRHGGTGKETFEFYGINGRIRE